QIKNFLGHLRAGLDADHASLGATVESSSESEDDTRAAEAGNRMIVKSILEDCDASRRGLEPGDELVSFAGRPLANVNNYKNYLGLYPKGWRMPLVYRRENEKRETLARLMGVQRGGGEDGRPRPPMPRPRGPQPPQQPKGPPSPALKFYEAKKGFANFYFNRQERDRLLAAFRKHGD